MVSTKSLSLKCLSECDLIVLDGACFYELNRLKNNHQVLDYEHLMLKFYPV